jgi:hypothetical protein
MILRMSVSQPSMILPSSPRITKNIGGHDGGEAALSILIHTPNLDRNRWESHHWADGDGRFGMSLFSTTTKYRLPLGMLKIYLITDVISFGVKVAG